MKFGSDGLTNKGALTGLIVKLLIVGKVVNAELMANLDEMSSREVEKIGDARYGARSSNVNLF